MSIEGGAAPHSRQDATPTSPSSIQDESHTTEQSQELGTVRQDLIEMRRRLSRRLEEIGEIPEQLVRVGLYAEASAVLDRREQVQTAIAEIDRRLGPVADAAVDTELLFDRPPTSDERLPAEPQRLDRVVEPAYVEMPDSDSLDEASSRPAESSPNQDLDPDSQVADGRVDSQEMLPVTTVPLDEALASVINRGEQTRHESELPPLPVPSEHLSPAPIVDSPPPATDQVTVDRLRWIRAASVLVGSAIVILVVALFASRVLRDSSASGAPGEAVEAISASEVQRSATGLIGYAGVSTTVPTPDSAPTTMSAPSQMAIEAPRILTPAVTMAPSPSSNRLVVVSSPTPTPTITPTEVPATAEIPNMVMEAVSTLVRGRMDVVMTYPAQGSSTSVVLFDIDTGAQPMRLHLTTTYDSNGVAQTTERIIVGSQAWERQGDAPWIVVGHLEGVWGQLQAFLPWIPQEVEYEATSGSSVATITWYDSARNTDMLLTADPVTGIPRELQQVSRDSGTKLVVTYTSWNQPVEIQVPQ